MNHYDPRHVRSAPPFRETAAFKVVALTALTPVAAGLVATGGAVATYYHHVAAGPAYAMVIDGHTDPDHSEPGGEWVRIATPEYGSTAITMRVITGPGD
jgi:hypothetical protein